MPVLNDVVSDIIIYCRGAETIDNNTVYYIAYTPKRQRPQNDGRSELGRIGKQHGNSSKARDKVDFLFFLSLSSSSSLLLHHHHRHPPSHPTKESPSCKSLVFLFFAFLPLSSSIP